MRSRVVSVAVGVAVLLTLVARDAEAWGPKAQRNITSIALQWIHRAFPTAYRADSNGKTNFEADVFAGALAAVEQQHKAPKFQTEAQVVLHVGEELVLLREARRFGAGSYFAYRMGYVGGLISDLMLPFALPADPATKALRAQIEKDIDAHVDRYIYRPAESQLQPVRHLRRYLDECQTFQQDALRVIEGDYRTGHGYSGYLAQAAPTYFANAVRASAELWFTVLRTEDDGITTQPSKEALAAYLGDEIEYLLTTKRRPQEAAKKYAFLPQVDPRNGAAYERVGDLFAEYARQTKDDELLERAVKEWRFALDLPGVNRQRIQQKLAAHFIAKGKAMKDPAQATAQQDLEGALAAFEQALEYEQSNREAANLLSETQNLKRAKDERLKLAVSVVASAEQVMKQAERSEKEKDYASAILIYRRADGLFDTLDEEFPEQKQAAEKSQAEIDERITSIINERLNEAEEAIDSGEEALEQKQFDIAINSFGSVEGIVQVIPGDDVSTAHGKSKQDLIDRAKNRRAEAERAKAIAEAQMAQQAAAGQPGLPGIPAPEAAPAAPAAPGAMPGFPMDPFAGMPPPPTQ